MPSRSISEEALVTAIDFWSPSAVMDGVTATGTNQATAFPITKRRTIFTTVAAGTGALLPGSCAWGADPEIVNRGANTLLVYPAPGHQVETYGTNTAVEILAGGNAKFSSADPPSSSTRTWRIAT